MSGHGLKYLYRTGWHWEISFHTSFSFFLLCSLSSTCFISFSSSLPFLFLYLSLFVSFHFLFPIIPPFSHFLLSYSSSSYSFFCCKYCLLSLLFLSSCFLYFLFLLLLVHDILSTYQTRVTSCSPSCNECRYGLSDRAFWIPVWTLLCSTNL